MLAAILIIGLLLFVLVLKIAKGMIKLALIILLLALIIGGAAATRNEPAAVSTSL